MKILFDILHPAHVHKFKNIIWELQQRGHKIYVSARDKEVTLQLLKSYKIPFVSWKRGKNNLSGKIYEFVSRFINLCKYCKKVRPDVLVANGGLVIVPVGKLLKIPTIITSEEADYSIFSNLIYSWATVICTSHTFRKDLGPKHIKFKGFAELSYLKDFKSEPTALKEANITKNETYFIIRAVSWKAIHDYGKKGFDKNLLLTLAKKLKRYGTVLISDEGGAIPKELEPYIIKLKPEYIHTLLHYATMFIGDGQIMSVEAGLLGTPAIRFNSLVGTAHGKGKFEELNRLGIVCSVRNKEQLLDKIEKILKDKNSKEKAQQRAKKYLDRMDNVTNLICNLIEERIWGKLA